MRARDRVKNDTTLRSRVDADAETILALADQLSSEVTAAVTVRVGHDLGTAGTVGAAAAEASVELSQLPRLSLGELSDSAPTPDGLADLEIVEVLGEGGMGVVYSARQRSLKREVALKVVRADSNRPEQLAILLHEARLMGSLEHPGIIAVHALGIDRSGRPLLVMQKVEGTSWQDLLGDPAHPMWTGLGKLSTDRLLANLEILMQVSSTVAFAHSRGVLHRDLKPANVLIGEFGEVFVADWGVAVEKERLAPDGLTGPVGTPSFMAPELVLGDTGAMDARTDVYLLGATLHTLLTGKPRHEGDRLVDVLFAARASEPPVYGDDVPAALAALATRATARDPEGRPASALEFRDEIAEFLRHRASLELTSRGEACLARARSALASRTEATPEAIRAHLVEGRFAFAEALREWSDNTVARAGLDRLLETQFDIELAERSPGAARATLAQLSSSRPDLERRLSDLERSLGEDLREREEARLLVRDLDPTVASRKRTLFVLAMALVGVALTMGMRSFRRDGSAPVVRTILLPGIVAIAITPVAWWLRSDLRRSALNRGFLAIVYALLAASTLVRAIAYLYQTPIEQVMTYELCLVGAAGAMLGITLHRAFYVIAVGSAACAFGAYAVPDWIEAFYVLPFVATVAVSGLARRSTVLESATGRR